MQSRGASQVYGLVQALADQAQVLQQALTQVLVERWFTGSQAGSWQAGVSVGGLSSFLSLVHSTRLALFRALRSLRSRLPPPG